jgi:predicted metalloprotease
LARSLTIAVLLAAVLIAGCGSNSGGSETTGEETQATTNSTTTVETGDLGRLPDVAGPSGSSRQPSSQTAGRNAFLREVFDDAQSMWSRDFADGEVDYRPARLTIFVNQIRTECGTKSASSGPFYCPADRSVYLDSRFFDALARQAGVRLGDFAQAYVVAHEIAHHVQFVLGIGQRINAADRQDPAGRNARSVRFELQADCLAGVWIHSRYQRGELSQSDLDDALNAAAVVGSDFQQVSATGTIRPEEWTHGSSSQRRHWLTIGFEDGSPAACDPFSG